MKVVAIILSVAATVSGYAVQSQAEGFRLPGSTLNNFDSSASVEVVLIHGGLVPRYICGGALVDPEWILIPAQCIANNKAVPELWEIYQAFVGDGRYHFKKIITHDKANNILNDLALVLLSKPVQFYRPVLLPKKNAIYTGEGMLYLREKIHGRVNRLNITLKDVSKCKGAAAATVLATHICAGDSHLISDPILLGSILLVPDTSSRQKVLIGFLSYAKDSKGNPAVFTRVSSYIDWIAEKVGKVLP